MVFSCNILFKLLFLIILLYFYCDDIFHVNNQKFIAEFFK
jgi:hypothetical protein